MNPFSILGKLFVITGIPKMLGIEDVIRNLADSAPSLPSPPSQYNKQYHYVHEHEHKHTVTIKPEK